MDKSMGNIMDMLCEELEGIAEKGSLSAGDLETLHKLVITKEKLLRIEELEEDLGYSNNGDWRAEGSYSRYSRGDGYMNGESSDSYGRHYVRGHYSRRGGRYSMSEGKDMMMEEINSMLNDPNMSASDKGVLRKAINLLR